MAYCVGCGTQAVDGDRFCGGCGRSHEERVSAAVASTATVTAAAVSVVAPAPLAPTSTTVVPAQAPPVQPEGKAKFVGDARPIAGISITRMVNAACYLIAGVALIVVAVKSTGVSKGWPIAIGIGFILYGIKILVTRTSYWVNSLVYLIAAGSVIWAFTALSGHHTS